MKKILIHFITLLLATSFYIQKVNAQKRVDSSLFKKKITTQPHQTTNPVPLTPPKRIIQIDSQPSQANPSTTSTTNSMPTVLPDIIVTDINLSPNTANTYMVKYTLKNIGNTTVKKGLLSVQSFINGNPLGGAKTTTIPSEINQLLNPGESISGNHTFSTTGIIPNTPYTIMLCVNGMKINGGTLSEAWVGQQFTELNYTNNSMQSTFTIAPPPPTPADLEAVITGVTRSPADSASFVRIYYTLKNVGETAIPQNATLTIQTSIEDTDNNPATFVGTACCGQPAGGGMLETNEIPFTPGEVKNLYYDAKISKGYYPALPRSASYRFNIEINNNNSFTDGNNANNKSSFIYFLQ